MHNVIKFCNLDDAMTLVVLIALLEFVGRLVSRDDPVVFWWARGFAAAGLLGYAGLALEVLQPKNARDFLALATRAALAMGLAHGLARIVMPVVCYLHRVFWAEPLAQQRAWRRERERQAEQKRIALEEEEKKKLAHEHRLAEQQKREEERALLPPPPTREELMQAAQERYESTLRMINTSPMDDTEKNSAKKKAKQKYLYEIDGVM